MVKRGRKGGRDRGKEGERDLGRERWKEAGSGNRQSPSPS